EWSRYVAHGDAHGRTTRHDVAQGRAAGGRTQGLANRAGFVSQTGQEARLDDVGGRTELNAQAAAAIRQFNHRHRLPPEYVGPTTIHLMKSIAIVSEVDHITLMAAPTLMSREFRQLPVRCATASDSRSGASTARPGRPA